MPRTILAALAATAALSLAACGSDSDNASGASTAAVKASVEQAAGVQLAASPIPEQARKQGLTGSFSNEASLVEDEQVVFLFTVKDADTAGHVKDMVRTMVPPGSKVFVNDTVLVLYASSGDQDHGAAVEQAVKAL